MQSGHESPTVIGANPLCGGRAGRGRRRDLDDEMAAARARCEQRVPTPRAFASTFETEGKCPLQFGVREGPPRHFTARFAEYCSSSAHGGSTLACQSQLPGRVANNPAVMCDGRNLRLDPFRPLGNETPPAFWAACRWGRNLIELSKVAPWRHAHVRAIGSGTSFGPFVLREGPDHHGCRDPNAYELCNGSLTARGNLEYSSSLHVDEDAHEACGDDADVISHPVVSFHRGNSFNPFHAHESFLALWTTYLARNLDPCDTGLLLHDAEVEGHLYDFLRRVFAPVHGISRLPAARVRPACFRRLVFAVQPRHNFEFPYGSRDRRRAPCGTSSWLIGFTRFVRASFGLAFQPPKVPRVTFADRVPIGSQRTSRFRRMTNRDSFVRKLTSACETAWEGAGRTNVTADAMHVPSCELAIANFAELPVARQLKLVTRTDVLVGTHAAAFVYLLYLPPRATIVEFASANDWHYDNLAQYMGIKKVRFVQMTHFKPYRLNVEQALHHVNAAVSAAWAALRAQTAHEDAPIPSLQPRGIAWPIPVIQAPPAPAHSVAGPLRPRVWRLRRGQPTNLSREVARNTTGSGGGSPPSRRFARGGASATKPHSRKDKRRPQ